MSDTKKFVPYKGRMVIQGWPAKIREAQEETHFLIGEENYRRIPYGSEVGLRGINIKHFCHDCGAEIGQYHVVGCDIEECPKCGHQAITCSCEDDELDDDSFNFKRHREK